MVLISGRKNKAFSTTRLRDSLSNIMSKKLKSWPARLLAVLLFAPLLVVSFANANQPDPAPVNNQDTNQETVNNETVLEDHAQNIDELSSQVEVKAETNSQVGSGAQTTVQGNVSSTSNDGTRKTKSFHKTYTSQDGSSSSSLDVSVNTDSESDTKVQVKEGNNSSIVIDLSESTEVNSYE